MLKTIAVRIAFLLLSVHVLSAAVDCRSPRNRQQRIVCSNPELMNLDQHLSRVYGQAMAAAPGTERKRLQDEQRSWEDDGGGCWERVDCIKKRYSDRIATLLGYIGHLITASTERPPAGLPTTNTELTTMQPAGAQAMSQRRASPQFSRQTLLAAVKDRLKMQSDLMEAGPHFRPAWELDENRSATWQSNIVSIAGLPIPSNGGMVSFGIALAYLASQESTATFASRQGDGLIHLIGVDSSRLTISLDVRFRHFGQQLLRAMFSETEQCPSQGFLNYSPSEVRFANSICTDLKQTVSDARREYANAQLLATEIRDAKTAIQRTRDMLIRAKHYGNAQALEAALNSLETALPGDDLKVIRAKVQALTTANQDLSRFMTLQMPKATALASARETANRELAKTQTLLGAAEGFNRVSQVESIKKPLESALAGEDSDEITIRTQSLVAINRDLDSYIQRLKLAAESKRQTETGIRALLATKQRAEKVVESANAQKANAARLTSDRALATAMQQMTQIGTELNALLKSVDPRDEPQISRLTEKLASVGNEMTTLARQTSVLSTRTGRCVYEGCFAWAQRNGIATFNPVRVFKDEETNKAADLAMNMGEHYCRCMTVEIAGDTDITDAAKLEIGHDLETKDRENNQQLALVVAVAGVRCQKDLTNQLIGRH